MSEASVGRTTKRVLTLLAAAALAAGIASSTRDTGAANAGTQASVSAHSSAAVLAGGRAASRPGSALRLARLFPGRGVGVSSVFHTPTRTDAAAATCGTTPGLVCTQIDVPLDRTGSRPGTISLHVETLPTVGPSKGVMFLIAGGPGQGSADAFDLGTPDSAAFNRFLFPGYTLVAYDDRGTGQLRRPATARRCRARSRPMPSSAQVAGVRGGDRPATATTTARAITPRTSRPSGSRSASIASGSSGSRTERSSHWRTRWRIPTHVERLLLDSVLPPELPDPFFANVLHEMPAKLAGVLRGRRLPVRRRPTSRAMSSAVSNQLAATPRHGKVSAPQRQDEHCSHDRGWISSRCSLDADLNPGLAADAAGGRSTRRARVTRRPLLARVRPRQPCVGRGAPRT